MHFDDSSGAASVGGSFMSFISSSSYTIGLIDPLINFGYTFRNYVFAPVPGFSSFGVYTGNASADGPFVTCGFRPKFVMVYGYTLGGNNTGGGLKFLFDTTRFPNNENATAIYNAAANAEGTYVGSVDMLANGFKVRNAGAHINTSTMIYAYMAFAEAPFKYALAR
jgi:hypothetical protein